MVNKNKLMVSLLLAMMIIMCSGIAMAAISITNVSTLSNAGVATLLANNVRLGPGYVNISINTTMNISAAANSNCSAFLVSTTTANTTAVRNESADAVNKDNQTIQLLTTFVEDGLYSIYFVCSNTTNTSTSSTFSVYFDNTVPAVATSLTETGLTTSTVTLTSAVTDARTTACRYVFTRGAPGSSSTVDGTYSTTSCTYDITQAPHGTWCYQVEATDGTNDTRNSEEKCFTVDNTLKSGGKYYAVQQQAEAVTQQQQQAKNNKILIGGAVALFIILILRSKKMI